MNICSLNNNFKYCIKDIIIKKIYKLDSTLSPNDIDKKDSNDKDNNHENLDTDIIIKKLADRTDCNLDDDDPQKGLCILKALKQDDNEDIAKIATDALMTEFKPITTSFDHNYWINNSEIDHIQHQIYSSFKEIVYL